MKAQALRGNAMTSYIVLKKTMKVNPKHSIMTELKKAGLPPQSHGDEGVTRRGADKRAAPSVTGVYGSLTSLGASRQRPFQVRLIGAEFEEEGDRGVEPRPRGLFEKGGVEDA